MREGENEIFSGEDIMQNTYPLVCRCLGFQGRVRRRSKDNGDMFC